MSETPLIHVKDEGNFIQFNWDTIQNNAESAKKGRPVHDKVLMVSIISPGQANSTPTHEVEREFSDGTVRKNEKIFTRYGSYIEQFKKDESGDTIVPGTPIDIWPPTRGALAAKLRSMGVHNVEALSELSDAGIQSIGMGGRELVKKAKEWLKATEVKGDTAALVEENTRLKEQVDGLQEQLSELSAKFDELEPAKKTRSRRAA